MDARSGESVRGRRLEAWLQRERESGRFYKRLAVAIVAFQIAMVALSYVLLSRDATPGTLVDPPLIALLLIANLIPAIALMVLYSRQLAFRRAERGGLGGGSLHTRLVALFSVIAAVPTVIVAIFASLLFQSGLEFWFSDRARSMFENTVQVAQATYRYELGRVSSETTTMAGNMSDGLKSVPINDPRVASALSAQAYLRSLNEVAIVRIPDKGEIQSFALINGYKGMLDPERFRAARTELLRLPTNAATDVRTPNRIAVLTRLDYGDDFYLYAARLVDPEIDLQTKRANDVLDDYRALLEKSRANQLRFNAALLLGALIIVALAIAAALKLADRLVRPVGELVGAAGRIEEGDFTARVKVAETEDEVQTLAIAFNRMTERLEQQTTALRTANTQLDTRRAFIEAVLSSVTSGVIALDTKQRILLVNRSAEALLERKGGAVEGKAIGKISPELKEFVAGDHSDANVIVGADGAPRTLAVKRVRYRDGSVLTFDDITDQLNDQRRAAWSDIARRIAHEIKNPLTPIQLAAERLQRRFGKEIASDGETFERLTGTIVRQVGDLRRMVDEFSNFARMPKPVFKLEDVHEIARQALFLHEVAHPGIGFALEPGEGHFEMVCDRRQLSQALTNVVKNGVEAIEARRSRGEHSLVGDRIDLRIHEADGQLVIDVLDTGVGLPEDRERLTEPYMTTRVRGTGLGLAIVKKIVEEHMGEISFLDRSGGGTHVRISFDTDKLAALAGERADEQQIEDPGEADEAEED